VPHPDLDAEQSYVDDAYRCLAAMRERTRRASEIADNAAQAVDSAIAHAHLAHRLGSLDDDVPGLSFGRLDGDGGDTWYVGRRHVEDDRGDPVVVDWRADVAVPFYRATAADPLDLRRRRRFVMTGRTIDDLFDEVFDDPDSVDAAHHGGIPDPLLAELERERTGEMRDIVATIAAEQDEVIRAPLETCLVVQGGPGTGKTAVGLHRAAFLLYEHRRQLDAAGVLVVGPNPIFLRYMPRYCRRWASEPCARPRSSGCWPGPRTGGGATTATTPHGSRATVAWRRCWRVRWDRPSGRPTRISRPRPHGGGCGCPTTP
jgi:DNA helicase IV